MKKLVVAIVFVFIGLLTLNISSAEAQVGVALQLHNPQPNDPSGVKSQFVMRNDSAPGIQIDSILWSFVSPVFVDSAAGGPGAGAFRDYFVAPGETYSGDFDIVVGDNSDVLVGYTGPTSFTDGATGFLLTFNDFDPNEAYAFWTDLDGDANGNVTNAIFGGSTTKITFSDGTMIDFTWVLPENPGRTFNAQLTAASNPTGVVPEPTSMLLFGTGLLGAAVRKKLQINS